MDQKNWMSPFINEFWGDRIHLPLLPKAFHDFSRAGSYGPTVDLKETDSEIILHADLPGVSRDDLDITVDENVVILKGETKGEETREDKGYHLTERRYGSFHRIIPLPVEVKSDQAVARYKNGVLELRMPKVETAARRGFKPKIETEDDRPLQ